MPDENEKAENFIQEGDLPAGARILVDIVEKDPEIIKNAYNRIKNELTLDKAIKSYDELIKKTIIR